MATNFKQVKDDLNTHLKATNNPHKVTSKKIWGLDKVQNTSDAAKPVTTALQAELDKKISIADIYNSTATSSTKDLTKLPWSAAQGYSMNNTINAYQAQDTSALEQRITNCENNV